MVLGAAFLLAANRGPGGGAEQGAAPPFTLMSTDGAPVSLSDYRGRNVLLYFNEGVGCGACFSQMAEFEQSSQALSAAGVTVVPIVANPVADVRQEMAQFGLHTPYLIDPDTRVSQAYSMLGQGMHANLPGHGFALVDASGRLRWHMEYPSMYVSTSDLLAAIGPYLG